MAVEDHTKVRPWRMIDRRKSRQIHVGNVAVGGDAPISVQSMANTPTSDANATISQIRQLEDAGGYLAGIRVVSKLVDCFRRLVRWVRFGPGRPSVRLRRFRGWKRARLGDVPRG